MHFLRSLSHLILISISIPTDILHIPKQKRDHVARVVASSLVEPRFLISQALRIKL
jgi:hypothetical protein